ncbi:hypothetical protein [Aureitalea marina]|uniref:DUF4168 domain-containing protein n=1 Tax=Aureitalea marina TaxID=930804 RepID=A0A2S7KN92_9FLAO|nr:hypothetical protein [Aureitalea marina]PQB04081.1 hypothetical protein BST85_03580 [Aureitalea marina]
MMKKISILMLMSVIAGTGVLQAQVRPIQPGQRGYTPPPLERAELNRGVENTLADLDAKMEIYQEEFNLDAFEMAVLKNSIIKFEEDRMAIMAIENMDYAERREQIEKLKPAFYKEVEVFLTEDEINRFIELYAGEDVMKSEMKKRKKAKKKKKKKNNG